MANVEAFQSGFGVGKDAALKGKKPGESSGIFTKGAAKPFSLKKGGKVKKTGMALVHKGEVMLTKEQAKKRSGKGNRKRVTSKG